MIIINFVISWLQQVNEIKLIWYISERLHNSNDGVEFSRQEMVSPPLTLALNREQWVIFPHLTLRHHTLQSTDRHYNTEQWGEGPSPSYNNLISHQWCHIYSGLTFHGLLGRILPPCSAECRLVKESLYDITRIALHSYPSTSILEIILLLWIGWKMYLIIRL